MLGDSVSWGNGIHDLRRIYPTLLERKLNQGYGPHRFEVINAAVPGYSTFQELRYLELYGLALRARRRSRAAGSRPSTISRCWC